MKKRLIQSLEKSKYDFHVELEENRLVAEVPGKGIMTFEDYTEDKEVQDLIVENPDPQQDIIFGEEIQDTDMLIDNDYQGENSDDLDDDL